MKLKIKNKKRFISICILALLLIAIITSIIILNTKKSKPAENLPNSSEPFVNLSENGKKTNISSKVQETKNVEGLDFSEIKITSLNNQTSVTGKIKNNSSKDIKGFYFKLSALNESGEIISESEGLLDSIIESGSTNTFSVITSKDFANCYDIQITKIKDVD